MEFIITFDRRVGAGAGIVLGADGDPNTTFPKGPDTVTNGNLLSVPTQGISGDIGQCVLMGYKTAIGSPVELTVTVYAWETTTKAWYKVATGVLTDGEIVLVGPIPSPTTKAPRVLEQSSVTGKLDLFLSVADNTSPDGVITFGAALSQVGLQAAAAP